MSDVPPYPGMPRWAKVSGIIVGIAVLAFAAVMTLGGGHNPDRHRPTTGEVSHPASAGAHR